MSEPTCSEQLAYISLWLHNKEEHKVLEMILEEKSDLVTKPGITFGAQSVLLLLYVSNPILTYNKHNSRIALGLRVVKRE